MATLVELRERVSATYGRLDLPSWPDPHPGPISPRDDEYSRVTQPERFGIVQARARAWAEVLVDVPGVESEPLEPAPLDEEGHLGSFDRGIRLSSVRPRTLALFLLEQDVHLRDSVGTLPMLHISVVAPEIAVERVPICGCDACDSGSAALLRTVDEAIGHVVAGPFVVLRSKDWQAEWHPYGGSSGGTRRRLDHRRALELGRRLANGEQVRLPKDVTAFVGHSWLA